MASPCQQAAAGNPSLDLRQGQPAVAGHPLHEMNLVVTLTEKSADLEHWECCWHMPQHVTEGRPDLTAPRSVLMGLSGGRPPTKVICTGHSLGAGVASLCGLWATLQWVEADVRVVTFGSPAVGNQQFADVRAPLPLPAPELPSAGADTH